MQTKKLIRSIIFIFIILFSMNLLTSCATIEIRKETEFVFPVIPKLEILKRPEINKVFTERKVVEDGKTFYLVSEASLKLMINNELSYKALVESYENQVKAFNEYRKMYRELMERFHPKPEETEEK